MTDTSPEAVEATPEDRKAAEDALFVLRGFRTRIPSLKHSMVQAFARHRLAAEAEAAALREALRGAHNALSPAVAEVDITGMIAPPIYRAFGILTDALKENHDGL